MLPFVPFVNVCAFQMVYQQQGQIVENVLNVQFPAPPTPTSMATVAAAFVSWHAAELAHSQVAEATLERILVSDLTARTSAGIEYGTGLPAAGAGGGSPSPMNVTIAVKWTTSYRGRSFRGRTFHVGLREEDYLGSVMLATPLASMLGHYQALITTISALTGGYNLVVCSRRENKALRITGVASIVTGCSIDSTLDSQRRRLPGRGR